MNTKLTMVKYLRQPNAHSHKPLIKKRAYQILSLCNKDEKLKEEFYVGKGMHLV